MKKVYIINGAAGVGKDTFVEIAKYYFFINLNEQTYNISSVDKVKTAASILGWDGEKNERGRKFLSDLKDLSSLAYNAPYQYMLEKTLSKTNGIFFLHIREPEEISYFKKYNLNTKTILIKRNNLELFNNHADQNINDYKYDYIINNDGSIENLVELVKNFVWSETNTKI